MSIPLYTAMLRSRKIVPQRSIGEVLKTKIFLDAMIYGVAGLRAAVTNREGVDRLMFGEYYNHSAMDLDRRLIFLPSADWWGKRLTRCIYEVQGYWWKIWRWWRGFVCCAGWKCCPYSQYRARQHIRRGTDHTRQPLDVSQLAYHFSHQYTDVPLILLTWFLSNSSKHCRGV